MQTLQYDAIKDYRPLSELTPAHWQTSSVELEDGATIHYTRTGGAKPAVLLLHGVQANGLTWLRTARALESSYDVVMPDFRGHGRSSRLAADGVTLDSIVNDMIMLIHALKLDPPHVVGHSMGADIAGRLAATFAVRALVLVDPALHNVAARIAMPSDEPPPWMRMIMETMQALRAQPHSERLATGLRLLPPGTPVWDEADYVSFVDAQAQFDLAMYQFAMNMGYLFEDHDVIARITCPILLLTARAMMPGMDQAAGVAAFTQHWRDGHHIHFADSGHFIPFDQFERFVQVLTTFLNDH